MLRRYALAVLLTALPGCSGSPSEQASKPGARPAANRELAAAPSSPSSAKPAAAAASGRPTTSPGVSTLDEAYCAAHDVAPDSGFDNARECYMLACSLGDLASCDVAKTYNVNLWPDGKPPATAGRRGSPPPARREYLDYVAARGIILEYGWHPLGGPCEGFVEDATCHAFPEIGYCQGTGRGFCDMNFDRNGHCVLVITSGGPPKGGEPGDTRVEDVSIGTGPCLKDPNAR
jgi:hypothetical protein